MTSNPIAFTLDSSNQKDLVITGAKAACFQPMWVNPDGSLWVGEVAVAKGSDTHVYLLDATGAVKSTVTLPYRSGTTKGTDEPPPWPNSLLYDSKTKTLWIACFEHGIVYRLVNAGAGAATANAEIYHESKLEDNGQIIHDQYISMVYQEDTSLLWVVEIKGTLFAFDVTKPAKTAPKYTVPILPAGYAGTTASIQTMVYHKGTKTLWVVLQPDDGGPGNRLAVVPASKAPLTKGDVKYFPLPDAQTLAADNGFLYVGGAKGQLWQIGVGADLQSIKIPNAPFATLLGGGGAGANLVGLVVDASGYLWAADDGPNGLVYGVMPPAGPTQLGQLQVTYLLQKGAEEARPVTIAWAAPTDGDSLYVADESKNGRVIRVHPLPGVGPVDPSGKAAYTLDVRPAAGTSQPSAAFEAANGVVFEAKSTTTPRPNIRVGVALSVASKTNSASAKLTDPSPYREIRESAPFLTVRDLVADASSSDGTVALTASGRGRPQAIATYIGTIQSKPSSVAFDPLTPRVTAQGENFALTPARVKIDPPPSTPVNVTVTLTGPDTTVKPGYNAHFGEDSTKFSTVFPSSQELPAVKAGTEAGAVTLTPSVSGVGTPAIWTVIPKPDHIEVPRYLMFHSVGADNQDGGASLKLSGHKILHDTSSQAVPVPGWPVRLRLDKTDQVVFKGPGSDNQGQTLVLRSDRDGKIVVHAGSLGIKSSKSSNHVEVRWNEKLDGTGDWYLPDNVKGFLINIKN